MLALEYDPVLAREAAFAEGFRIGFVEGFKIGRAIEKFSLTKKFLEVGTPIKYIVAATGWTEEKNSQTCRHERRGTHFDKRNTA